MKTSHRTILLVLFASMIIASVTHAEMPTEEARQKIQQAVASGDVQTVIKVLPAVQEMWPEDMGAYFQSAEKAVRFLGHPADAPAVRQAVEQLYTEVMDKRCPEDVSLVQAATYFKGKKEFALYLFGHDDMRYEPFYLLGASRFLGEIRKRAIPGYLDKTISFRAAEIRVLDEAGVSFASDLKDPRDIAAYAQALKADQQTMEYDRLQRELFSANSSLTTILLYACRQLHHEGLLDDKLANEVAENARLTDEERIMEFVPQ